jgi:hypothetical protein
MAMEGGYYYCLTARRLSLFDVQQTSDEERYQ